jgi:hypothetical protein
VDGLNIIPLLENRIVKHFNNKTFKNFRKELWQKKAAYCEISGGL